LDLGEVVAEYLLYKLDSAGHISGVPTIITQPDDGTAIDQAKQLVDGHDLELWDGQRLVGKIPRRKK
jgi:hypothetical protein